MVFLITKMTKVVSLLQNVFNMNEYLVIIRNTRARAWVTVKGLSRLVIRQESTEKKVTKF
jgi:hypothetical protein